MEYPSVLFRTGADRPAPGGREWPDFFSDLHLDQVFEAAARGREQYDLQPFFCSPLEDVEAIVYRQEVFEDIARADVSSAIRSFAQAMRTVRGDLEQDHKLYYDRQKQRWFLDAVLVYCGAVSELWGGLARAGVSSRGLRAMLEYLGQYRASEPFVELQAEAAALREDLSRVTYAVQIKGSTVTVRRYADEEDYSAQVERTFRRFREADAKDYRVQFAEPAEMDHVEARILDLVADLYPEVFSALAAFRARGRDFVDEAVATFDREVQFYLAISDLIEPLRRVGLAFCRPELADADNPLYGRAAFDIALAAKLEGRGVVRNDWEMTGEERIFVVSGPNQGGKTTFTRAFGQMHYLAKLGCPVPAAAARLLLYDRLFTHFERQEQVLMRTGKLEDDLLRMRAILERATARSIVLINEMLASTTLRDGIQLGTAIMEEIRRRGSVCIWVTFIEELARDGEVVVSLVSQVAEGASHARTYRVERRPPGGVAYALSLAERYGLTYEALKERIRS